MLLAKDNEITNPTITDQISRLRLSPVPDRRQTNKAERAWVSALADLIAPCCRSAWAGPHRPTADGSGVVPAGFLDLLGSRVSCRTLGAFTIFPSTGHCIRRIGPRCTEPNKREVSLDTNR
jgi:hypothetical protein